jgi:GMP synthase-like glutamine amidotransferase
MDEEKKHLLSTTHAYESENFPLTGSFDLLLVMGGPMNIYEYDKYPWLKEEKKFLRKSRFGRKSISWNLSWSPAACRCPQGKSV